MSTSVLTLVRGREAHLRNLMRSLALQSERPGELVIAWMGQEPFADLPDPGCPRRDIAVPGEALPLASARNRAAEAAANELLIFLDVDCIASPGLVAAYREAAAATGGLFLGEVLYLPKGAAADDTPLDFTRLDRLGRVHPAKPAVPAEGIRREPNAGELWGLSFALRRERYLAVGGMDEDFRGYGGEETDLAWRLAADGLAFYWTGGARTYHQHHPVLSPPLHLFDDILRNAALFRRKHGRWCMDYWLGQFRERGLVDWSESGDRLERLRSPSAAEIEDARRDDLRFS